LPQGSPFPTVYCHVYAKRMKHSSFATRWNADLIDEFYNRWLESPDQLEPDWRAFFEGFELGADANGAEHNGTAAGTNGATAQAPETARGTAVDPIKQARVIGAIYAYRSIGHTEASVNPLATEVPRNPRLSLERLGFTGEELDSGLYYTGNYLGGQNMTVRQLLDRLRATYCGSIGVEYLHIQETPKRRWLQAQMEPSNNQPDFDRERKLRILRKVYEAEIFERFLHTRYVGQKRFSLEGAETMLACLDSIKETCPGLDIREIVMGMAHRGRLNVLANFVGKSYGFIFREFGSDYMPESIHGDGDVKYHLGYESITKTSDGREVEVRLASNPSHLEAVNPVVEGKARARQRIRGDLDRKKVLPLLIHGDAALAGQGIVAEVFNLAKLKGYRTGGTIHIVVNNQIGFTTDPHDARSSRYCTDVAKMIEAPVFHVNGDDPLAVCMVARMATEYRQQFGDDVVIDMYCYRKHGHNEADEPAFTQPTLYRRISQHEPISELLTRKLIDTGDLNEEDAEKIRQEYQQTLDDAFEGQKKERETREKRDAAEGKKKRKRTREQKFEGSTAIFQPPYSFEPTDTRPERGNLDRVAEVLTSVPENFSLNRKIARQLKTKREVYDKGEGIDWAFAESLAFGTLLLEGTPVRLSGQDSERGTFSQRHSAYYDIETRVRYVPLLNLGPKQATFCVHNSSLSEAAILGFDFGYSLDYPEMLALWEAQFGDFVNGAQVIIDQFITSSESKWQRVSGLVMLLPHGYEGQGPEHSSARLERFLQACAEDNIQVCNLTKPAQYFHLLRRQMKRVFRKPLVIMAPKSLLRHKECTSSVTDLAQGTFQEILDDPEATGQETRLIFCSGKVYYDLLAFRRDNQIKNAAIIRLEQFYPFHAALFKKVLKHYPKRRKLIWCQEEPQNMGGWSFLAPLFAEHAGRAPQYAGRGAAASPAPGSLAQHEAEQASLVETAFSL